MSAPKNLEELFMHTLKDIYYAEKQLIKALPKLAENSTDAGLRRGFSQHLKETETHLKRLEDVFKLCGAKPTINKCPAIDGIIKEGDELMKNIKDGETRDAAIIAAAQAAEHYEIARYGALISWACRLGKVDVKNILRDTIAEEKDADSKLTRLAEDKLNKKAAA